MAQVRPFLERGSRRSGSGAASENRKNERIMNVAQKKMLLIMQIAKSEKSKKIFAFNIDIFIVYIFCKNI